MDSANSFGSHNYVPRQYGNANQTPLYVTDRCPHPDTVFSDSQSALAMVVNRVRPGRNSVAPVALARCSARKV